jgi:DHA1 family multidrug resistance protein-like MFS transporter
VCLFSLFLLVLIGFKTLHRFGWTGFTDSIHWMAPTAAGVLIGFGVLCIFLPCFNYLVDAYLPL